MTPQQADSESLDWASLFPVLTELNILPALSVILKCSLPVKVKLQGQADISNPQVDAVSLLIRLIDFFVVQDNILVLALNKAHGMI